MNGRYSRFTTDKLLDFLKRLDRKVTIRAAQGGRAISASLFGIVQVVSQLRQRLLPGLFNVSATRALLARGA